MLLITVCLLAWAVLCSRLSFTPLRYKIDLARPESSQSCIRDYSTAFIMMEPSDEENQVAVAPGVAEINHNDDNEETKEKQEEKNDNETTSPFPISFYCSITGKLMVDPVVHPNGDSYERSAIMEQDSTLLYYPNRALKAYIEQGLERFQRTGSMRGLLQNWNDSMRSGWQKLLDKSALPSGEYRPLPGKCTVL